MILEQVSEDIKLGHKSIRSTETIVHPCFQSAKVKVVEVAVQSCISITLLVVFVLVRLESFAEEISHVSKCNQDRVTDIGRQQVEVGGFVWDVFSKRSAHMLGDVTMGLAANEPKL